jgi:hypothetical protein
LPAFAEYVVNFVSAIAASLAPPVVLDRNTAAWQYYWALVTGYGVLLDAGYYWQPDSITGYGGLLLGVCWYYWVDITARQYYWILAGGYYWVFVGITGWILLGILLVLLGGYYWQPVVLLDTGWGLLLGICRYYWVLDTATGYLVILLVSGDTTGYYC